MPKTGIPGKKLIELYKSMLKIRKVELRIEELYSQDEMKTPVHLCIGQEATSAGVCACLKKEDYVFTNHRGHGHYLAKGGDLKAFISELYCKEAGCSRGRGGSMHLIDERVGLLGASAIVGGSIPIAVGAALGSVFQKKKSVSAVFFGDAAAEQGVLYESLNYAALKKLPVIFVCENNFYSVFSNLKSRQVKDNIYLRAKVFSMPAHRVDGTNVMDVYSTCAKAVKYARSGKGPVFMECRVYRWRKHVGPGSDIELGYRSEKELDSWLKKCPVNTFKERLLKTKLLNAKKIHSIDKELDSEISEAFEYAQKCALPDKKEALKYLFHEKDDYALD
ncbi:MAG: thiamine pyrophosphate-dependent dehydrogenase E1 component subunit alpha [Candidatus Omnitrophota bacterium]